MADTGRHATRRDKGAGAITKLGNGRYRAFVELSPDPADGSRRRTSATGHTRTEALNNARAKARRIEEDITLVDEPPTVNEWMRRWIDEIVTPRRAPNTTRSYRFRIEHDITPVIGAVRMDRLKPAHIRLVERHCLEGNPAKGIQGKSPATAALTHTVLSEACKAAVAEGIIRSNPVDAVEKNRVPPAQIATLTPGQAAMLIHAETDPRWSIIWRLLFITALREGEALGVTRNEIVRSDGLPCLLVEWQLKEFDGITDMPAGFEARRLDGRTWLTRPKTRSGRRLIPLPADLAADLAAYTADHPDIDPDTPLFRSGRGNPIRKETLQNAWRKALERVGLPRVRVHSARHTAATAMARIGVSDLARRAIIGPPTSAPRTPSTRTWTPACSPEPSTAWNASSKDNQSITARSTSPSPVDTAAPFRSAYPDATHPSMTRSSSACRTPSSSEASCGHRTGTFTSNGFT